MTAVGELPGLEHGAAPADDHDHTMPKLSGVTGAATVVDDKDKGSPDDWVPRREEMIRLTGLHPFNSEPPLSAMMDDGFFTSPGLHYIRNHGAVPQLDWSSHTISLQSADGTTVHELTMDELSSMPTRTIPVTMNCTHALTVLAWHAPSAYLLPVSVGAVLHSAAATCTCTLTVLSFHAQVRATAAKSRT